LTALRPLHEVACPSCGTTYRVDANKVPRQGGFLTCPSCSHRWQLRKEDLPSTIEKPEEVVVEAAPATPRTLSCPACGHEFSPQRPTGKKSILIVDDQEFFRNFAVDLLSDQYQTHVAKSTAEALRKAEDLKPDLIVLDLGLEQGPEDGRRILHELGGRFPVVIMTGRDDFDLYGDGWREFEQLGARDLVVKSLTLGEELPTKVQAALGE